MMDEIRLLNLRLAYYLGYVHKDGWFVNKETQTVKMRNYSSSIDEALSLPYNPMMFEVTMIHSQQISFCTFTNLQDSKTFTAHNTNLAIAICLAWLEMMDYYKKIEGE